jgi:hypothetical protein
MNTDTSPVKFECYCVGNEFRVAYLTYMNDNASYRLSFTVMPPLQSQIFRFCFLSLICKSSHYPLRVVVRVVHGIFVWRIVFNFIPITNFMEENTFEKLTVARLVKKLAAF